MKTPITKWVAHQKARSRGGRRRAELGVGHILTPEKARKIAKRYWNKRRRERYYTKRSLSIGRKVRAKNVKRQPLRMRYSLYPPQNAEHIFCVPSKREWFVCPPTGTLYRLSERTALRRLGHLPYPKPAYGWRRVHGTVPA